MDDKLKQIYSDMITESEKAPGDQTIGEIKQGNQDSDKYVDIDTPEEGPSSDEVKKGGASANKKEVEISDSFDFSSSSNFEELYTSIVGENEDIVSAPDVEGDSFDDDIGDFEGDMDDDVSEETNIATELRTMAERLSELADRYGEPEEEEDMDFGEEGEMDEDEEEDVFEAVKSEPEPKPHNPSPNRAKTAKGKLSRVSKKKGKNGIKGKYTGEPQELSPKGGHTNTTGNTARASGPSASKKATDAFC